MIIIKLTAKTINARYVTSTIKLMNKLENVMLLIANQLTTIVHYNRAVSLARRTVNNAKVSQTVHLVKPQMEAKWLSMENALIYVLYSHFNRILHLKVL